MEIEDKGTLLLKLFQRTRQMGAGGNKVRELACTVGSKESYDIEDLSKGFSTSSIPAHYRACFCPVNTKIEWNELPSALEGLYP